MRRKSCFATFAAAFACLLGAFTGYADVRLPAMFSDNMVLQRGMRVPVFGWADDGERVTVSFRDQAVSVKAKGGKWLVKLGRLQAGGPDMLVIKGKNTIEIKNVLVGEVWICSGQSNMEWPLSKSFESGPDIAASANPMLRLLLVSKTKADKPLDDVKAQWKQAEPESVPPFSAVAYYFGRELQRALKVPVGLIETCWGGSPAEAWTSETVLAKDKNYKRDILDAYQAALKRIQARKTKPQRMPWRPAELYNGMLAPLMPYAIAGAIWYQGESNASRAYEYRSLYADMIRNWRNAWGQGDFPFLAVQLAPYDKNRKRSLEVITEKPVASDWAELREAQLLATEKLPHVGMAVITDVGEKDDIHPTRKEPVGARLALAARALAYDENIEDSGPVFRKLRVRDGQAVLSFRHVNSGLEARGGPLTGFAICGPDQNFVWANARIDGEQVIVSSPLVSKPVAVRYGWADFPVVNLWNQAGLPATPFRTDDFPMTTKK